MGQKGLVKPLWCNIGKLRWYWNMQACWRLSSCTTSRRSVARASAYTEMTALEYPRHHLLNLSLSRKTSAGSSTSMALRSQLRPTRKMLISLTSSLTYLTPTLHQPEVQPSTADHYTRFQCYVHSGYLSTSFDNHLWTSSVDVLFEISQSQPMHSDVCFMSLLWATSSKGHVSGLWLVNFDPSCLLSMSKDGWRKISAISAMHVKLKTGVKTSQYPLTNSSLKYHMMKHHSTKPYHLISGNKHCLKFSMPSTS